MKLAVKKKYVYINKIGVGNGCGSVENVVNSGHTSFATYHCVLWQRALPFAGFQTMTNNAHS